MTHPRQLPSRSVLLTLTLLGLALLSPSSALLSPTRLVGSAGSPTTKPPLVLRALEDQGDESDAAPSDVDESALVGEEGAGESTPSPPPLTEAELAAAVTEKRSFLFALGASTARGEAADLSEKLDARLAVEFLESAKPVERLDEDSTGTWELAYCSTQLFRSSPFFMAGRAVCQEGAEADRFNWFCDMHRAALAISTIQRVRQIVSDTRIVSEFEVSAGAVPFVGEYFNVKYSGGLPLAITGSIVSSADIDSVDGAAYSLLMDTVEIKGSNVPGLRQALDSGLKLQSRTLGGLLEENIAGYTNPRPVFRVTYLEDDMRICRDQDNNIFVYFRSSSNEVPTDYGSVTPDLGVGKLISGLQRALLPQGSSL